MDSLIAPLKDIINRLEILSQSQTTIMDKLICVQKVVSNIESQLADVNQRIIEQGLQPIRELGDDELLPTNEEEKAVLVPQSCFPFLAKIRGGVTEKDISLTE